MKIIKLILLLTILFKTTKSQNRLDISFSLGNGKPFAYKNSVRKSENSNTSESFNKAYGNRTKRLGFDLENRVFNLPQYGIMLEYKLDRYNTIGVGLQKGRTEIISVITPSNSLVGANDQTGATLNKWGIEYTRKFFLSNYVGTNSKLSRLHFSLLAGAFWVRHRYNNYENDGMNAITFINKDSLGNTVDSTTSNAKLILPNGFIMSIGLRVGLLTKKKKLERLSLTVSYDQGFIPLWEENLYYFHNYLKDYTITTSNTRGSQFKIYLSLPITIYKPKK